MDERIKSLWANNKIFFFLLLPIFLLIFFKDIVFSLLLNSARGISNDTKKKDDVLKAEADKLNNEADKLVNDKPVVDENWNKP